MPWRISPRVSGPGSVKRSRRAAASAMAASPHEHEQAPLPDREAGYQERSDDTHDGRQGCPVAGPGRFHAANPQQFHQPTVQPVIEQEDPDAHHQDQAHRRDANEIGHDAELGRGCRPGCRVSELGSRGSRGRRGGEEPAREHPGHARGQGDPGPQQHHRPPVAKERQQPAVGEAEADHCADGGTGHVDAHGHAPLRAGEKLGHHLRRPGGDDRPAQPEQHHRGQERPVVHRQGAAQG